MTEAAQKQSANFDLSSLDLLDLGDPLFSDSSAVAAPDGQKFVIFQLGSRHYGIPTSEVAEIFQPLAVTSLPTTPEWLVGIANFRNEIISVIDLKRLLMNEISTASRKSRVIVLRCEGSDTPVALLIDKLSEMANVPDGNVQPVNDESLPFVYGRAEHKAYELNLLEIGKLLASLSF